MSHRLIVLPDDTAEAILAPINAARPQAIPVRFRRPPRSGRAE